MAGDDVGRYVAYAHEIVGPGLHRKGAAGKAPADKRVVDHHAAVGQHQALTARNEEQRAHARRHTQADRAYGVPHRLHDVVERKARLHLAARAVDIEGHGGVCIAALEIEQAADDRCARIGIDGGHQLQLAMREHVIPNIEMVESLRRLADDLGLVDKGAIAHGELLPRVGTTERRTPRPYRGLRDASTAAIEARCIHVSSSVVRMKIRLWQVRR